ncbi:MAG: phosphoribosylformylglycinamidine synthase, partial [Bacteroidales bacterium]|nr:phosphoribosylformylglycinamidine synthase [Bacteroidales bacterium]
MIYLFKTEHNSIIAVKKTDSLTTRETEALCWLFNAVKLPDEQDVQGCFTGPRIEMVTPWSTTAVEITRNMNISGIERIEEFFEAEGEDAEYDKMLQRLYTVLGQKIFNIDKEAEKILSIEDIAAYNISEGLAL